MHWYQGHSATQQEVTHSSSGQYSIAPSKTVQTFEEYQAHDINTHCVELLFPMIKQTIAVQKQNLNTCYNQIQTQYK